MTTKRKAAAISSGDEEPLDPSDELLFYCLGGGNEVGRSCHIIQYKGKTVMVRLHSIRFDSISKVPTLSGCGSRSLTAGDIDV